jgi:hypothetical protein
MPSGSIFSHGRTAGMTGMVGMCYLPALPDGVKEAVAKYGKDEKPKGVLHQGRVYVVADMHTSEADVEATILHESEGHVGVHRLYCRCCQTSRPRCM